MVLRTIITAGIFFSMIGCASLTSFQDARTVEKGTGRAHIAYNQYKEIDDSDTAEGFMLQLGGRFGLTDKIDMGITYMIPGSVIVDGKYQFTAPTSKLGLSSGLKLGYLSYSINEDTIMAMDAILPVYLSYYPFSWLAFTVNPDAVARIRFKGSDTDPLFLAGGNASIRLGKSLGIVAEYGYHLKVGSDRGFQTIGGSFYTPMDFKTFLGMFGL